MYVCHWDLADHLSPLRQGAPRSHDPSSRKALDALLQVWFADDGSLVGPFNELRELWDRLTVIGPPLGYFPKASKTVLIAKSGREGRANCAFAGSGVQVTDEGSRHLGAALGSLAFRAKFLKDRESDWAQQLSLLAAAGRKDPHVAQAAFVRGFRAKWNYILRTIPDASDYLSAVDLAIRDDLAPSLLDGSVNHPLDLPLWEAVQLPCRLGGLGLSSGIVHGGKCL